jgi:cellulose synthase/poly-beta-1,6-N-acetylglucosamine synthase-like glycosyltransferase
LPGGAEVRVVEWFAALGAAGILLVWIVYPAIIGLLAKRCRCPEATHSSRNEAPPSVSVIIATRDDPVVVRERIIDCLSAAHDAHRLEVIVGLDYAAPPVATDELAIAPTVRVVRGDMPGGKAATLNAAVRAAQGDLLLFTDSQQRFEAGAVSCLVAAFADEHVGAASGRLELSEKAQRSPVGRYWSYERWLRRCEAMINSCVGATGAIWALRRSLWTPLPPSLILDDVYAPMRVVLSGQRVVFVDEARAVDLRHSAPRQEYRRKVRTLTGVLQLCCWLPQLLVPARNPIWAQFVFHKLLRLLTPYWLIGLAAWGSVFLIRWIESNPIATGVPLCMLAALSTIQRSKTARVIRSGLVWIAMLQAAVVVAAVNSARRRWDVWSA